MVSNSCESTPDREIAEAADSNEIVQLTTNDKTLSSSLRRRKKGGNGPITLQPDGLCVENARTLMQEFGLLNVAIPDLTITEVCRHPQETLLLLLLLMRSQCKIR